MGDIIKGKDTGRSAVKGYSSWRAAKERCYNPQNKAYEHYGGRGIVMCQRWRNSAQDFLDDLGARPEGLSLDRIDNEGNYSCGKCLECIKNSWPANCKWSTISEQRSNRRHWTTKSHITHCRRFGHSLECAPLNRQGARRCILCEKIRTAKRKELRRGQKRQANNP